MNSWGASSVSLTMARMPAVVRNRRIRTTGVCIRGGDLEAMPALLLGPPTADGCDEPRDGALPRLHGNGQARLHGCPRGDRPDDRRGDSSEPVCLRAQGRHKVVDGG